MDKTLPFPEFPPIPDSLIVALEARFPVPVPEPTMTDREIWLRRGHWAVIEFLKFEQERQNSKTPW